MLTRRERNAYALPVRTLPSGGLVEFEGFERITALKKMVESEGVPTVDVTDLMKVWKHVREVTSRYGNQVAIDIRGFEKDCSPGANIYAVWFVLLC
jgi:hypothetical protein